LELPSRYCPLLLSSLLLLRTRFYGVIWEDCILKVEVVLKWVNESWKSLT